jgi:hypothetical protein
MRVHSARGVGHRAEMQNDIKIPNLEFNFYLVRFQGPVTVGELNSGII